MSPLIGYLIPSCHPKYMYIRTTLQQKMHSMGCVCVCAQMCNNNTNIRSCELERK